MDIAQFKKTATTMKFAGDNCAIAAGGYMGMANAIISSPPSIAPGSELHKTVQMIVDAAPTAAQHLRDCADAMEKLGNAFWASLADAGANGEKKDERQKD